MSDILIYGITLRMFRLNICLGLPAVALDAENSQEISNRASGKGAHLEFPGAYGRDSDEKNPHCGFFSYVKKLTA